MTAHNEARAPAASSSAWRPPPKETLPAALRSALEPILSFLEEDSVIEISLNDDGWVWVERAGQGMRRENVHIDPEAAMLMLRQVARHEGRELNEARSSLTARLPGSGARFQGVIPPAYVAPIFSIRKPGGRVFTLADYIAAGILTERQAEALAGAVRERANVAVGGGTGSGKTALVNALLQVLDGAGDRILTIEDTLELRCGAPNKLICMVHPEYTWQRAVMDAMRLRPDRIIVGEVRDGAAHELLKAWNTGHPGGLCTLHADDTRGMLDRFCDLIGEAVPGMQESEKRRAVARTVNVCVHIKKDPKAKAGRSVTGIDRVLGLKDGDWQLEPLVA